MAPILVKHDCICLPESPAAFALRLPEHGRRYPPESVEVVVVVVVVVAVESVVLDVVVDVAVVPAVLLLLLVEVVVVCAADGKPILQPESSQCFILPWFLHEQRKDHFQ